MWQAEDKKNDVPTPFANVGPKITVRISPDTEKHIMTSS